MPVNEIATAFTALNGARSIVSGLVATRDAVVLNNVKISLQNAILEAQAGLFAAQQEVAALTGREADLKEEVVRLKDWSADRANYALTTAALGVYVYQLTVDTGEPPHWLCAKCYEGGKKSVLQRVNPLAEWGEARWLCQTCDKWIVTDLHVSPEIGR